MVTLQFRLVSVVLAFVELLHVWTPRERRCEGPVGSVSLRMQMVMGTVGTVTIQYFRECLSSQLKSPAVEWGKTSSIIIILRRIRQREQHEADE